MATKLHPSSVAETRFEALVRQYGRLITAVVARVGGARVAAAREDVAQEVLLALWKRLEREQTLEVGSSYVYKAAVRETVRALQRERSKLLETLDENNAPPNSTPNGPFEHLAESERGAQIESCLASLPLDRARAVRAHLRGFEIREIMGLYGWPYQKARNLVARGLTDLRRLLRERGVHD
jgi:RNA polymerase sigma factor (sigma-70 family)